MHPEALQQRLLDQLRVCDEVVALTPEELLEELKALQLHALYGVEDFEAKPGQVKMMLGQERTEQFLVEQVRGGVGVGVAVGVGRQGKGSMREMQGEERSDNDWLCCMYVLK